MKTKDLQIFLVANDEKPHQIFFFVGGGGVGVKEKKFAKKTQNNDNIIYITWIHIFRLTYYSNNNETRMLASNSSKNRKSKIAVGLFFYLLSLS